MQAAGQAERSLDFSWLGDLSVAHVCERCHIVHFRSRDDYNSFHFSGSGVEFPDTRPIFDPMCLFFVLFLQVITPRATTSGKISIPSDSMMAGISTTGAIRATPELSDVLPVLGVEAADQLYQTARPYKDTIAYFDQQFRDKGFRVIVRNATQTSTAWHITRPDGRPATLVVRNTTPTSFEVIEIVPHGSVNTQRGGIEQHEPNQPDTAETH